MRPGRRAMIGLAACVIALIGALPTTAVAVSQTVIIRSFAFVPANATILAGDSITWQNVDGTSHTATSNAGAFDTGVIANGASRTVTFAAAGTFAYHCAVHPSMTGTITVQAPAATASPTPVPTVPRTAAPTAPPAAPPTAAATAAPTDAPAASPTLSPTPSATGSPAATIEAATQRPLPSATAGTRPTAAAPSAEPTGGGGPGALVAGFAVGIVALGGLAVIFRRRR